MNDLQRIEGKVDELLSLVRILSKVGGAMHPAQEVAAEIIKATGMRAMTADERDAYRELKKRRYTAPSVPTRDGGQDDSVARATAKNGVNRADDSLETPVTTRPGPSPIAGARGEGCVSLPRAAQIAGEAFTERRVRQTEPSMDGHHAWYRRSNGAEYRDQRKPSGIACWTCGSLTREWPIELGVKCPDPFHLPAAPIGATAPVKRGSQGHEFVPSGGVGCRTCGVTFALHWTATPAAATRPEIPGEMTGDTWRSMSDEAKAAYVGRNDLLWRIIRVIVPGASGYVENCLERAIQEHQRIAAALANRDAEIDLLKGEVKAAETRSGMANVVEQFEAQLQVERAALAKAEERAKMQQPVIDAAAVFVRDSYRPSPKYDGERFDALCSALSALGINEQRAEDAMLRDRGKGEA